MDLSRLAPYVGSILHDASFSTLPHFYSGKVRDSYDLDDERRLMIASDRLSAFDIKGLVLVPFKGVVLTQTARYWFEETASICPNQVLSYPDPAAILARKLKMLPVEFVVRGYLAGTTSTSILTRYKEGERKMYGVTLPEGMRPHEKLAAPMITPTTKGDENGHDEALAPAEVVTRGLMTQKQWDETAALALALFAHGQKRAAERGLILADTKYEFGIDETGAIVLADEIHTPDSSRFWDAATYAECLEKGMSPVSFDKDIIRTYVRQRCNPYIDPIPTIPEEMVLKTAAVYIDAYEKITGQSFELPSPQEDPRARLETNLRKAGILD